MTAYRLLLDAPDEELARLHPEAEAILAGAYGRHRLRPFRTATELAEAIRPDALGTAGQRCGAICELGRGGFMAELSEPVGLYDTLRVQPSSGDEGLAVTVTRLVVGHRSLRLARAGQRAWIACDHPVEVGSLLFRSGSATDDLSSRVAALPLARAVVDLTVVVGDGAIVVETAPVSRRWQAAAPLVPARGRPLTPQDVAEQLRKTRSSRLAAGVIRVELKGDEFLPASALKALRRSFWSWAEEALAEEALAEAWSARRADFVRCRAARSYPEDSPPLTTVIVPTGQESPLPDALTARYLDDGPRLDEQVVLPDFCGELELADLARRIDELVRLGHRRFRATSLHGLALLAGREGLEVAASFPLPACNSLAVAELLDLGAQRVTAWVELERESLVALLVRSGAAIEQLTYGRPPLLTTRLSIPAQGLVTDNRGACFELARERGLTTLYAEATLSVPPLAGTSQLLDLSRASLDEGQRSDWNDRRGLV